MGLYERADLYDRLYDWDVEEERAFLLAASRRWGRGEPRAVLEPFCGPARLLASLPGRRVGFDESPAMLRRAVARGVAVFRADAARFALRPASFDLAFCLIDSFRHLRTRAAARAHLRAMARALRPDALYVLGFEVTGDGPPDVSRDRRTVAAGACTLEGSVGGLGDVDPDTRLETVRSVVEVRRGTEVVERVESLLPMRVWGAREFEELVDEEASFEPVAAFDRGYAIDRPVELPELAGSAVVVLRREPEDAA